MKLPISRLNYSSQPLSDDTYFVVDKLVDGQYVSRKLKLRSLKDFILYEGTVHYSYDETEQTAP